MSLSTKEDVFLISKGSQIGYVGSAVHRDYAFSAAGIRLWLAETTVRSEPAPEENDESSAVQVVVGKTLREKIFGTGKHVFLEVYAAWCGACKKFAPIYEQFAERMLVENRDLIVAKIDGDLNDIPFEGFDVQGFPTLFYMAPKQRKPTEVKLRTLQDLFDFVKKAEIPKVAASAPKRENRAAASTKVVSKESGESVPPDILSNFKSESVPDKQHGPVRKVVLKNFIETVFDDKRNTALVYHSPKCPHCIGMMPEFEEFAKEVEDDKEIDMILAKFDGTANDMPFDGFEAKGYPTVWFIQAGKKSPSKSWVGRYALKELKAHVSQLRERDEL